MVLRIMVWCGQDAGMVIALDAKAALRGILRREQRRVYPEVCGAVTEGIRHRNAHAWAVAAVGWIASKERAQHRMKVPA
jgi:hypothetical protein